MATIKWNQKEKRFRLDIQINGERKCFTSSIPGNSGKADVRRKYELFKAGQEDKSAKLLEDVWPEYIKYLKAMTSEVNCDQRDSLGKCYILPVLGKKKMEDIIRSDWQNTITYAKPIRGWALSKKSYKNLRATIMNFCKWARDYNIINTVPDGLRTPTNAKVVGKNILEKEEIIKLFKMKGLWYQYAYQMMILIGLRPGEAYGIKKTDIKNGVLKIRRAINSKNQITTGKNDNARRIIVLSDLVLEVVMKQIEMTKHLKSEWLFPDEKGNQADTVSARYFFTKHMGEGLTPYCLRHSFITHINKDMPLSLLRQLVGHSSTMDTIDAYGHALPGDKKAIAKIIDDRFAELLKDDE